MNTVRSIIVFFIFSLSLIGCLKRDNSKQTLIDPQLWSNDMSTCSGYRSTLIKELEKLNNTFVGYRESDIMKTFGKPDQTLLYERGQKFFEYKLACDSLSNGQLLRMRFNALGFVNEILIMSRAY